MPPLQAAARIAAANETTEEMMTAEYLILVVVLAFTLGHCNRLVRAAGTFLVALGLTMIVASIILAGLDGTFAAIHAKHRLIDRLTPLILNLQALAASVAIVFLFWAAWQQPRRAAAVRMPLLNTRDAFGLVSRYAHWTMATLILCLIPMGIFMSVLPDGSDREASVSVHESRSRGSGGLPVWCMPGSTPSSSVFPSAACC